MGRIVVALALFAAVAAAVGPSVKNGGFVVEPANLEEAPYAPWAHGHWVWLSADRANQTSMLEYVQEYLDHNITVSAADFDSGWSTGFNNFIFDTTKYPDPQAMVTQLHNQGVRVIFWATSMIDTDSSNYQDGLSKGYYIKNLLNQPSPIKWWHGHGCLLDYTNPAAVQWWHNQMDAVLNIGIDGWKTDGTDPFILEYVVAHGFNGTVSYREYADLYYGDFFDYTRSKLGKDRLIMSRPEDGVPPLYLGYSPRRVVFSGWVGDQDPTWDGLRQALLRYLQSGWNNYVGFGSDIGGYRSKGPKPYGRETELFVRWYQLGAFSSLMENGGDNEHRPWAFDAPGSTAIADNYRMFVDTHLSLVPYLLTTGADAYTNNVSILVPMAPHSTVSDQIKDLLNPATFQYLLGTDILVAPVMANTTSVNVSFTADSTVWAYWWNTAQKYSGNNTVTLNIPLTEFPVFSRVGAIIPMHIASDNLPYGASWLRNSLTIHLNFPQPSLKPVTRHIRQFNSSGLSVSYQTLPAVVEGSHDLSLSVSATEEDVVFMISGVSLGKEGALQFCLMAQDYLGLSVVSTPEELMASEQGGIYFDDEKQLLYIRPFRPTVGVSVVLPSASFAEVRL